ncbi:MAG: AMP-binding protein [Desulfurococcales archaeon]|nr:AMP-binding protein [Desulfurococcales archaeon]
MQELDYFGMLKDKWYSNWPHPSLPKEPVYTFGKIPIHEYLSKHAAQIPSKDYLIYYGKRITYREIDELSNKLANCLVENGFKKGDRVALVLSNMPQFYVAYFGTLKAGGVSVLLNPMLKGIELEYFFKESNPKFIVTLDLIYPTVKEVASRALGGKPDIILASYSEFLPEKPEIPIHPSMKTGAGEINEAKYITEVIKESPPEKPRVNVSIDDNATMNFTGGTTGLPKGVYHKHLDVVYTAACTATYNLFAEPLVVDYPDQQVDFIEYARELSRSEVVLATMPIFWIAGSNIGVIAPTLAGATIVVLTRWDVKAALEAIHKYRVTTMYAPFDLYWEILAYPGLGSYDLTSLRNCMGSSFIKTLTKDLRYQWKELTGAVIREAAYGLTESHTSDTFASGLHKNDLDIERSEKYGGAFCGIPCPGTLIKIVDEKGNILPLGKQGEIAIKSPSVVSGYVGRPEETAKAFRNGWLFTGDIGMYDEDGFFYYISRKKYMLKVSGVSVYPTQIEFIMLKHPAIQLVGVIGISDPKKGQVPVAFVKLKPEYQGKVTDEELLEWCRKNMAPYNVPKKIIIKEQLPLTTSGKVIREELIKEYEKLTKS